MLSFRYALLLLFCVLAASEAARAADYTVKPVEALPEAISGELAKTLSPKGHQIAGPDGRLCSVWFVKSPAVKEGFSPTLSVKYPLIPGSIVGVLQVGQGSEFTDFREQVLAPGLYTMRYGQQPQDGNHIGTSDVADFLLALPAKADKLGKSTDDLDAVVALSTEAASSTHPAILSLRPAPEGTVETARLIHDAGDDFWILETAIGSDPAVAVRLVVVGFALE